jgi:putative glutamine amidotransferase
VTRRRRAGITQRVDIVPGIGERRDALDQRWAELLDKLGYIPVPLCNAVSNVADYVGSLDIDAIVLSGGNDLATLPGGRNAAPERDRLELFLIEQARQQRKPMLAVCRGLQMLNAALGGDLVPAKDHVVLAHDLQDCRLRGISQVNSFHDWAIPARGLASELQALARASDGTVEAVRHAELPWVGVMWHPERAIPEEGLQRALVDAALTGRAGEVIV